MQRPEFFMLTAFLCSKYHKQTSPDGADAAETSASLFFDSFQSRTMREGEGEIFYLASQVAVETEKSIKITHPKEKASRFNTKGEVRMVGP